MVIDVNIGRLHKFWRNCFLFDFDDGRTDDPDGLNELDGLNVTSSSGGC